MKRAEELDVRQYIGTVHEVTEADSGRTVTIAVGDGGPCPAPGRKPMITLTVSFSDGRRSSVAVADAAAGQLAEKLLAPHSVGVMGGEGWTHKIDREYRRGGPKNGRTSYTFTVFAGPVLDDAWRAAARAERRAVEERYAAARREAGLPPDDLVPPRLRW